MYSYIAIPTLEASPAFLEMIKITKYFMVSIAACRNALLY